MLENDLSPTVNSKTVYLKDYKTPDFLIPSVKLHAQLGENYTVVTSTLLIKKQGEHSRPLILDGEKIKLLGVTINTSMLNESDYQIDDQRLIINRVPNEFVLEIQTKLEPHLNTELSGLYQSSGNFCTQCEAEGFRRITYFLDRPDVLSTYQVTIVGNKESCPVLLSNGNLIQSGENDDGSHWAKWYDPHPKPCYLFALVAGDLKHISDQFITKSGNTVELNIYTQAHNINKCEHAMASLIKSMQWDEQVYGCEYDLDIYNIVAVDDFNMGAMENKGLNVFNSKYVLADQQSATDSDFEGIESVIAHEYFHNWSGNRVTCRDWFQLSLKEGFTVFRDQEFSADMGSRGVKRIRDVQLLRAHQFKEDAGPMAHPIRPDSYQEINNFYTVTIYEKGAEVIRMMHSMMGADGFRKGTDYYFDTFDGQAVTTEDFVQSMEKANNVDLTQFRLWYTQSGTPYVQVAQTYKGDTLTLIFSQSCPETPGQQDKQPFQIPISIALFDDDGVKQHEETINLEESEQEFQFTGLTSKPTVSLLRNFSAPIKVGFEQSDEELVHLIKVDDNGFSRWEAMQRLCLKVLLPAIESLNIDEDGYQILLSAFQSVLKAKNDDSAMLAEMLTLPSAGYIAELCHLVDPVAIINIRGLVITRLANDLETDFLQLYQKNQPQGDFSIDSDAMAKRALKNTALSYLAETDNEAHFKLIELQYQNANNMTDRLAAFKAIVHSDWRGRLTVIDDFYNTWKSDALVMDKWFAIQAMRPSNDTLIQVIALMNKSEFSMNNPNKVRSLIGAFTSNLASFHQKDGKGYEFLADRIIELNSINPQIAARVVSVFNNWKAFKEPFSNLMKTELERINAVPKIAKDVQEIVSKALS